MMTGSFFSLAAATGFDHAEAQAARSIVQDVLQSSSADAQ
jgi:hypothetical protein